jgi:hypothetical protein
MKMRIGLGFLAVTALSLSACGGSHSVMDMRDRVVTKLPAPLAKQIVTLARGLDRSLGDPSVKTAQVYGPGSRYALVKASSGDLVEKLARERKGFYLIVLYGRFICDGCSGPAGAKAPTGTVATDVWSPTAGGTDFGLSHSLPAATSHLRGPTVVDLG